MQRCLFFIFLLCGFLSASAQPIRIAKTEISFWFKSLMDDEVPARAEISFTSLTDTSTLFFDALGFKVSEVRLREGRLKDQLPFRQTEEQLLIEMPGNFKRGMAYTISLSYNLTYDSTLHYLNWHSSPVFAVFNPLNFKTADSLGRSGMFYPSLSGESSEHAFNLSLPKGTNLQLPAAARFRTDNQDGSTSHYYNSRGSLAPEAFYLVLGKFEEQDLVALQESAVTDDSRLEKLTARKVEARVAEAQEMLGITELSDSEYVRLDSLAETAQQEFYITREDVPGISTDQFRLNKTMFQEYAPREAGLKLYNFYREQIGEAWHQQVLEEKWQQYPTLPPDEKRLTLGFMLEEYRSGNEFLRNLDQEELDSGFYEPLLQSLALPHAEVSYRFVGSQKQLWIIVKQDTAAAPAYQLPATGYMLQQTDSTASTGILQGPVDTLKIPAEGAPNFAHLDFGENFPGKLTQNKPENYWLHQLSTAHGEEKTTALLQLFDTSNKNLFSTVLGIAMDDPDANIRLEALLAADRLDESGRQKLKDTILHMAAEDSSAEVQQAAQKLAEKYYHAK